MKQKPFLTLLVSIIVIGGLIGGAFAGGIAIGKNQAEETNLLDMKSQFSTRFGDTSDKGIIKEGTTQQNPAFPGGMGGFIGKQGTIGTVESIEDNVVTVETMTGIIEVTVAGDTTIQKMGEGSIDDITPGDTISVTGESEEDGSIEAVSIFITPLVNTP